MIDLHPVKEDNDDQVVSPIRVEKVKAKMMMRVEEEETFDPTSMSPGPSHHSSPPLSKMQTKLDDESGPSTL